MKTTTEQQPNLFPRLFRAIKAEKIKELNRFKAELKEETDVTAILDKWYYRSLITPAKKRATWNLKELKAYLIDREIKKINKQIADKLTHLETVSAAGTFESINITVEWKRSQTWGNNPNATAEFRGGKYDIFISGSIGGCGYDKESTAVAAALNQSNALLKALYIVREKDTKTELRALYGYGSGYGILPRFEGGVGVSCYPEIFAKIGYNWKKVSSGKTFDVYNVTPMTAKEKKQKFQKPASTLKIAGLIAAFGAIFTDNSADQLAWEKRMFAAAGCSFPEDWETLPEDVRRERLNKVKEFSQQD
jgi:hypothetical protein